MEWNNNIPEWQNEGTEPSENRKQTGFTEGYKPPAGVFNWFWSLVLKAIKELREKFGNHAENKENPHGVTKTQVGLGNVPNVATNDQTPTYTDTNTLTTLTSGEKLNVAFQKIKCAITNLINHLANKKNPHGVTCEQIGAVPSANSLAKSTDLDTVVTSGFYRINESPVNAPADVAYSQMLVVHGGNDTVAQIIFPYNQSRMFFRTGNPPSAGGTGAWKDWAQVYTSFNKPTPADIGALSTNGGGTVSADNIRPIVVKNTAENACYTRFDGKDGILGFIGFAKEGYVRALTKDGAILGDLYHTGNKPMAADIGAGELGGRVMANASASANLSNSQVRNISAGTSDLVAGTSSLGTGCIYCVYE